jgi:hypothetical protein
MLKIILIVLFLLPTLLLAEEITYPTADTAIYKGKTYHLKKASAIYQKLEEAK